MGAASDTTPHTDPAWLRRAAQAGVRADRKSLLVAIAVGSVAITALVLYLFLAVQWSQRPFIGALLTPALVVDNPRPVEHGTWSALAAGLTSGDRIVSLNDVSLDFDTVEARTAAFQAALAGFAPGDIVRVGFVRPLEGGESALLQGCAPATDGIALCTAEVTVSVFPPGDFFARFVIPFVSAGLLVAAGLTLLRLRAHQTTALIVAILCFLQAVFAAGLFDQSTSQLLVPLWILATVGLGVCFAMLALYFPAPNARLYDQPVWRLVPGGFGVVFTSILLVLNARAPLTGLPVAVYFLAIFAALLGLALLTAKLIWSRNHATSATSRDQSNAVLIGIALAFAPVVVWLINLLTRPLLGFDPLALNTHAATPFFVLPAISLFYAVFQYRLANTDRVLSQTITYTLMLLAVIAGYFLIVFGVSLVAGDRVGANNVAVMALAVFLIAVLFWPVRARLQDRIDALYYRQRRALLGQSESFAQQLTRLSALEDILGAFRAQLEAALSPGQVFIFLPDTATGEYAAVGNETDLRFPPDSPLLERLRVDDTFYLEPGKPWPPDLLAERARLRILEASVLVSLRGSQSLSGFVVVGPTRSGADAYEYEALRFLRVLAQQVSVAAERAQVVDSLERRVRELGVLSQVSQAVNFTLNFDDLLELIATQTERLVEASHLYIVLRDDSDELYFAFFLEDAERYSERENRRWPLGRDLFSEVIRAGQPLRVADYGRALAERGLTAGVEDANLKAWMAVPLVAGLRPLGLLAVGTTRPGRPYSDDQFNSLVDIASLAATSLDKARLFDETNARARQLAALNEVSRQLVAVESDLETLLTFVTDTAGSILDADAASLLLVADDGGLRYEVARGLGRERLAGTLLPAAQGLAGEVVRSGALQRTDDAREGDTRVHALAAPLVAQGSVIGVLEVLNRESRHPFSSDDADLLVTFAGQAAVAIENARLFRLTDFQLSQRVAELESMERIDVELNRSLDLGKVAEITVRSAVEYSRATAGLLGLIVPEQPAMQVVAAYGYLADDSQAADEPGTWPSDRGLVRRVIRTRRADLVLDPASDPDYTPGFHTALSQVAVPMLSGGEVSAVLLLETDREPRFNLAHLAYVQRLAEHASVAIANAQLYRELERANQSKSEFVSFVAHELKNPLTSIKGYSDILVKGAAGGLSDQQKMFVSTIRSNADRMNTLVSDLNDVTKLQTNNMRIDLANVAFASVVTDTLRPLQAQIEEKGQQLTVDMAEDLPPVHADKTRLIQVLTNLVSNAHKYTPAGGSITLAASVDDRRRDSKGRPLGPLLHVQVRDTGIGLSEADLNKLFTPYFRSDNPAAREQPGTGLGLTITQGLIVRQGGEIWAESAIGQGTTFHFTVPLAS